MFILKIFLMINIQYVIIISIYSSFNIYIIRNIKIKKKINILINFILSHLITEI